MSKDLIIALLALAYAGAAAALLVTIAKLDEWKQKAAEEHEDYIAALRIGSTTAKAAQEIEQECEGLKLGIQYLTEQNDALQDFKSHALCPLNDHFWVNGKCRRCGREKPV